MSPLSSPPGLSGNLIHALQNLSNKARGEPFHWTNIAKARELTRLGFAQRDREGWNITAEGGEALRLLKAPLPWDQRKVVYLTAERLS